MEEGIRVGWVVDSGREEASTCTVRSVVNYFFWVWLVYTM